ncbi:MAG: DUF4115 domain-containing protein, partial [Alphaproteobacteria bacterium]|nr:DUF4115 domain-containing protein [Alphaproteobacteria bacterium]
AKYLGVDGDSMVQSLEEEGLLKLNQFNTNTVVHLAETANPYSNTAGVFAALSLAVLGCVVAYAVITNYLQDSSAVLLPEQPAIESPASTGNDVADTRPSATSPTDIGDPPQGDFTSSADIDPVTDASLNRGQEGATADSTSDATGDQATNDANAGETAGDFPTRRIDPRFLALNFPSPENVPAIPDLPGQTFGAGEEFDIEIIALTPSWIEFRDSAGSVIFSRVIQPGDRYRVPRGSALFFSTGNAGGLRFQVYGEVIPPIGPEGIVRRQVLLTPTGLRALFAG